MFIATLATPAIADQQTLPYDTDALTAAFANASSDAEREQILKQQIRLFPNEPTPHLFLGNLYDKLNRPREARQAYQKVLDLSPGHLGAMNSLGAVYMNEKDYPKAEAQFQEILARDPAYAPVYVNYGMLKVYQKRYQEAIDLLNKAIQLDPQVDKLDIVHTYLGDSYGWLKQNDKAIQEYETVCRLNPAAIRAHLNLGSLYGMKAAQEPAVLPKSRAHFEAAMKLSPGNAEAQQGLSMVATLENRFSRPRSAVSVIRAERNPTVATRSASASGAQAAVAEKSPQERLRARIEADTDGSYSNALFETLYEKWGADELLKRFTAKVKENPADVRGYLAVGWVYERSGRLEEAAASYRQALQINPKYANARTALGLLYGKQGKHEQAIAEFQQVSELDPSQKSSAYNNLGSSHALLNQHEKAVPFYQKAIELQPANADLHVRLGQSLTALQRYDEAIQAYKTAARLNPTLWQAHQGLGLLYEKAGKKDEALEAFERVVQLSPDDTAAKEAVDRLKEASPNGAISEAEQRAQITDLLDRYQQAFGQMDMSAVAALFTNDSNTKVEYSESSAWSDASIMRQALSLEIVEFRPEYSKDLILPHDASAVVRERTERLDRTGDIFYLDTVAAYLFKRSGNGWKIYERTQPMRGVEGKPATFTLYGDEALAHATIAAQYSIYHPAVGGKQNDPAKVIAELQEAIALSPDRADWHVALAHTYMSQRDFSKAEASYKKALDLITRGKGPQLKLGNDLYLSVIHDKLGTLALQKPDLEEAERAFQEALRLNQENVGALNGLGAVRLANGDLPKARELFEKSLKLVPQQEQAEASLKAVEAYEKGVPLIDQKRFAEAKRLLHRAIELRPDFFAARFELTVAYNMEADALRADGHLDEALARRREALKFAPPGLHVNNTVGTLRGNIHQRIGNDLLTAGRFEEAAGEYEQAVAAGYDTTEVHLALATCYQKLGREEQARSHLKLIIDAPKGATQDKELAKNFLAQIEKDAQ